MPTNDDLRLLQGLPLDLKVRRTKQRIKEWVSEYGVDGVYISFSGGKDSTVLLDIARQLFANIQGVYVDTGLEYPEIREFVKTFDNITWVKPSMSFKAVIERYGYPMFSKEVSKAVYYARKQKDTPDKDTKLYTRLVSGDYKKSNPNTMYDKSRFKFMLDADFEISNKCCDIMKKSPLHNYNKQTGKKAITAQMAEESMLRKAVWMKNGCNGFNMKNPISNPMSFWKEQDVLQYIKQNNIRICSVYGDIVPFYPSEEFEKQIGFDDLGVTDSTPLLKTTKCQRTGCMFCGYGCHLNNDKRFVNMKLTHPKQYEWIMKSRQQGGLGYKHVIEWINENSNFHIIY